MCCSIKACAWKYTNKHCCQSISLLLVCCNANKILAAQLMSITKGLWFSMLPLICCVPLRLSMRATLVILCYANWLRLCVYWMLPLLFTQQFYFSFFGARGGDLPNECTRGSDLAAKILMFVAENATKPESG